MTTRRMLTNRALRNKVTGIDIVVPDFQESGGMLSSNAVYNVIVVTRLFYYKTSQHKESDVVQFMVQRKFEEFETLYHKLTERFPSVLFPRLPKKSVLVNVSTLNERKNVMNEVLQLVAKTQKLCCSPMVLEFLGVHKPQSKGYESLKPSVEAPKTKEVPSVAPQTAVCDDGEDLFVADRNPTEWVSPKEKRSFSEEEKTINDESTHAASEMLSSHAKLSIFDSEYDEEEKGEDDLFTPKEHVREVILSKEVAPEESMAPADLLDVGDDVDDLLSLSKKSVIKPMVQAKPIPKAKPSLKFKSPEKAAFQTGTEEDGLFATGTGESDGSIWKEGNAQKEEPDLFLKARKHSLRKGGGKHDSLDEIFKNTDSSGLFGKVEEDDLFSTKTPTTKSEEIGDTPTTKSEEIGDTPTTKSEEVGDTPTTKSEEIGDMGEDDITNYIKQNQETSEDVTLDLIDLNEPIE